MYVFLSVLSGMTEWGGWDGVICVGVWMGQGVCGWVDG